MISQKKQLSHKVNKTEMQKVVNEDWVWDLERKVEEK